MSTKLVGKFLPLGSMSKLKGTEDDTLLYFVVARAIKKNESDEIVPRYRVAPHPHGDVPTQEVFSIEVTQIVEVLFEGYENERDVDFVEDLIGRMTNSPKQFTVQKKVETQPEKTPEEDEKEKLKRDPFYKFRK